MLWNGPLGVFELPSFDTGTDTVERKVADLTEAGAITRIGRGSDNLPALDNARVL